MQRASNMWRPRHSRGLRYRGSTVAAKNTIAMSLWGSDDLLLLWQPSRSVHNGQPMKSEARSVVGYSLVRNCLWATNSIDRQRLVAKGWSAGLVTPTICAAKQPIRTSMRRRQTTACGSWSRSVERRSGSFAAARHNCCWQRSRSRSTRVHGLPRPGGLADGRVGRGTTYSSVACATFLRRRLDAGGGHVRRERDVRQSPEGRCGCTFHDQPQGSGRVRGYAHGACP
jgi:hypothetical protein